MSCQTKTVKKDHQDKSNEQLIVFDGTSNLIAIDARKIISKFQRISNMKAIGNHHF